MSNMKRYNFVMPSELFDQVQTLADSRYVTVAEILRTFVKLGLLVLTDPEVSVIRKGGDYIKEITWL